MSQPLRPVHLGQARLLERSSGKRTRLAVAAGAGLKIRDLTRVEGDRVVPAWPPRWVGSFHPESTATPGDGLLEFVMHTPHNTILTLTMRFDGREHTGILSWDAPPSAAAVTKILKANLGVGIGVLGDLDVVE